MTIIKEFFYKDNKDHLFIKWGLGDDGKIYRAPSYRPNEWMPATQFSCPELREFLAVVEAFKSIIPFI